MIKTPVIQGFNFTDESCRRGHIELTPDFKRLLDHVVEKFHNDHGFLPDLDLQYAFNNGSISCFSFGFKPVIKAEVTP